MILSIIIASVNGYALSNWRFKGSELFFTALIFGAFIPYQVMLYPLVIITRQLGIFGTLTGVSSSTPSSACRSLPSSSAITSFPCPRSCSRRHAWTEPDSGVIFLQIMLPMSLPIFVVAVILQVTGIWNDFLFGVIFAGPRISR